MAPPPWISKTDLRKWRSFEQLEIARWERSRLIEQVPNLSLPIRLAKMLTLPLSFFRLFYLEGRTLIRARLKAILGDTARKDRWELFNIYLHIGVTAQFIKDLSLHSMRTVQFLLSNHNHLLPGRLPAPDPVAVVGQKSWERLDANKIDQFQNRYKSLLSAFDGFLLSHTPAFVELVYKFEKPILVVVATRYETPYTNRQADWGRLNSVTCPLF